MKITQQECLEMYFLLQKHALYFMHSQCNNAPVNCHVNIIVEAGGSVGFQ